MQCTILLTKLSTCGPLDFNGARGCDGDNGARNGAQLINNSRPLDLVVVVGGGYFANLKIEMIMIFI